MDRTKGVITGAVKTDMPCWCGQSSRACAYYLEKTPHLHCHKCNEQTYDKDIIEEVLELNGETKEYANEVKPRPVTRGVFNELQDRSINRNVAERYSVETLYNGKEPWARSFQFKDENGNIVASKVKTPDKKMFWEGDVSKAKLFGQHLSPSGGKFITITEGEEDALAVYQILKDADDRFEPAVVSIKNGAGSAVKECQANWEYINSFENIIIAFDGDEPGRKAAAEVSRLFKFRPKVLTFHEAKEVDGHWQFKDGNDYLKTGRAKDFIRMWWSADQMRPKGCLSYASLWEDMISKENTTTVPFPWEGLNKMAHGLTTSHMYIIKAPPKLGKCFGKDTPVRMWDGSVRKVQDVKEGELLMGDDGTPRRVQGVTNGKEQLYKVIQNKGITYTVNESHILSLKNTDTKIIKDVSLIDYFTLGDRTRWKGYTAPILREEPYDLKGLDPYFIGLWLGDGTTGSPDVTNVDAEIIDYLTEVAASYGLKVVVRGGITYALTGNKGAVNPISTALRELDIFEDKRLPSNLILAPKEIREAVLAGLLDSDGYLEPNYNRGFEITQSRYTLAYDILELALSLGFRATMSDCKKACVYKGQRVIGDYYRVSIHGDFSRIPLKVNRKIPVSITDRHRDSSITGIEVVKDIVGDYFGFELDGNHRFLLSDCTVVHNTSLLKELIYHINRTTEENCGLFLLENTKKEIGLGLAALHLSKNISPWEIPEDLSELKKAHDVLSEGNRIMVFDPESDRTAENILEKMTYFVKANNTRFLFLDHITLLAYSTEDENERRFLDKLCANLKSLAVSLDICLVAVTHVNDEGKTRGSRASLQLCDVMINLERDKLSEDPRIKNTMHVIVEDNRWGECGKACSLLYNQETGRMKEYDFEMSLEPEVNTERVVDFKDDKLPW